MPRGPRLDAPGLLQHVIVRGIEQRPIFLSDADRQDAVRRLARLVPETQTACLAWCLLSNHLHLLVRSGPRGVAHLMRRFLTGYAVWFNRKYQRVGHLFQNRYKSLVCEEEPYLLALVRYIHLNPLRARVVADLQTLATYPWCGHGALVGRSAYPWQATTEVLAHYDQALRVARRRYEAFVAAEVERTQPDPLNTDESGLVLAGSDAPLEAGRRDPLDHRILGSSAFVAQLHERLAIVSAPARKSSRMIAEAVCDALKLSSQTIASRSRSRDLAVGRAIIAFLGRVRYQLTGAELSETLGMSRAGITLAAQRGERLLHDRADLRHAIDQLLN